VTRPDDDSVLPDQTRDDTDVGWGDDAPRDAAEDEDVRRLLDERPPHHIDRD
jgi:hypothetical protein